MWKAVSGKPKSGLVEQQGDLSVRTSVRHLLPHLITQKRENEKEKRLLRLSLCFVSQSR